MPAVISISNLPNGGGLIGTEQVPVVQNGVTIKVTTAQIAALGGGGGGGGTGTVTTVAVANNHGFSGSVATATTTPTISIRVAVPAGILKSDGTNLQMATAGTDYVLPGLATNSSLSINTARILGRTTAGLGALEEISIGSGLSMTAGTLVATSSGGSVTTASVVTANGFAGTVANASTTPAITLTTSLTTPVVKANGTALIASVAGTDFVAPGATGTSGLTMSTARLHGRTTAGTGAIEEITVGSGLTLSGGSLIATSSGGSVTSVSVTSANGFTGTVATATSTPAITLATSITGVLKGNGTAISAATAGVDIIVPGGALGTPSSGTGTNITNIPATNLIGNLAIGRFNSGTSAGGTTFWRGDGVWAVPGTPSAPVFTTALQNAVNSSVFLDWPFGDVTLTSPLVITVPNGSRYIGFDMHGARIICGFNNVNADLISFVVATNSSDFCENFMIYNCVFNGTGSPSFNGSTNQCRNGLVFQALGGAASMFGGIVQNCFFFIFPNGSGLLFYGGIFESLILNPSSNSCGIGVELRQQALGGGGQVLSTIYVIGGDIRQCGFPTPAQGNDMGGISSTTVDAFVGSHSILINNVAFVNHRGPGLYLAGGALQVIGSHFEACCRDASTPSHAAIYSFYGALNVWGCDGAQPDSGNPGGQNYLVEFGNSDSSRGVSTIYTSYNELEGGGTYAKLGKLNGVGTVVIDGAVRGSSGLWDGVGTWTVRTPNFTNSTV